MSKYFKLDKDKREIVLDKTKRYNVNIDILDLIIDLKQEIERLNAIIDKLNEKGKFLTDVANEKQNRIDRAMAYNNFILKEEWYGGNETKYAQRNIDILLGKETELKELLRLGVDKE